MQEAERGALVGRQRLPVVAHRFEQGQGADHIGLDERTGAVDGTIDMAFGGEVHHRIGLVFGQQAGHQRVVTDVAVHEHVVRIALQGGQGLQIARVGQRIQVDHPHALGDRFEDKVTANESGSAGDKPCGHCCSPVRWFVLGRTRRPDTAQQDTSGPSSQLPAGRERACRDCDFVRQCSITIRIRMVAPGQLESGSHPPEPVAGAGPDVLQQM
ncbi:hypothetical protein D3C73_1061320 [compost metagenome]